MEFLFFLREREHRAATYQMSFRRRLGAVSSTLLIALSSANAAPPAICPVEPQHDSEAFARLIEARQPDRGFLWRVSKNDRESFLYGTAHVAKLAWDFPGPLTTRTLRSSRLLAVELDATDSTLPKRYRDALAAVALPTRESTTADEASTFWSRVNEQTRLACLPPSPRADQLSALGANAARSSGLYPDFAVAAALIGFARATGKSVAELETVTAVAKAIYQAGGDFASQTRFLEQIEDGRQKAFLKLATTWADSDWTELERYQSWGVDTPEQFEALVTGRNANLAEAMGRNFDEGSGVFAAIGVLHMIGPDSVIAKLRALGFSVEPVRFRRLKSGTSE